MLETYLSYNTSDVWRAVANHFDSSAVRLPDPHPRVRWELYGNFLRKLAMQLKDYVSFRPLSAFDEIIFPSNTVKSIGAYVPTTKAWAPQVGIAVAQAMHIALAASVKRLGLRYLEIADSRGASGHDVVSHPNELVTSMPIDRYVASALCAPQAVKVEGLDAKAAKAAKGKPVGLKNVTITYEGARDPKLWNWIRVSPADATAEDVAAKVWSVTDTHGDTAASFNSYMLAAAPPLFGIPKKAAFKTKCGDYAPKGALDGKDSVDDQLLELANNKTVDHAITQQKVATLASKTGAAVAQPQAATVLATLGDCNTQLSFVANEVKKWGLASKVSPALGYTQRKIHEVPTLDAKALSEWSITIEGQKERLARISGGLHALAEAAKKLGATDPLSEAASPVREVLELFATAAGISHIPQPAEAKLQQALQAQSLLAVRALQSTESSMMGAVREVHQLAGDNKRTGRISSDALALQSDHVRSRRR